MMALVRSTMLLALVSVLQQQRVSPAGSDVPHTSPPTFTPHQHVPYFDQHVTIVEAESFTMADGQLGDGAAAANAPRAPCRDEALSACEWGLDGNLFACDVYNVWMSRRAYLHGHGRQGRLSALHVS
jgi:hypothetical protein